MTVPDRIAGAHQIAARALVSLALAAIAGCATNPWAMRDYAAVIEQARKVGAGTVSPVHGSRDIQQAKETVTRTCVVEGEQVGTDDRTTGPVGAVSYPYAEGCQPPARPAN